MVVGTAGHSIQLNDVLHNVLTVPVLITASKMRELVFFSLEYIELIAYKRS